MTLPQSLGWIDTVFLAVLLLSAVVGLWRGVVYEVLSLLGWVIAWFSAQLWGQEAAVQWLPAAMPAGMGRTVGYGLIFAGTLILWRILVWLVQQLVHASPVAPVDRALGGAFGLLRGAVILAAAVMLVGMTPLGARPAWQSSSAVQWAHRCLALLAPRLPEGAGSELPIRVPGAGPSVEWVGMTRTV
jgi:membrane protein required for colicin V production